MPSDLTQHIKETPLCDTHEHLNKEQEWVDSGPDLLQDLFGNYVPADLRTAGASQKAIDRLMDASDPDIGGRFSGIEKAWRATRLTGYGEAVRLLAREIYGMDEVSADTLAGAQSKVVAARGPGMRYKLLHDRANLDHVQVDDFSWPCPPDASGPDFFLYDLSWAAFSSGNVDWASLAAETGIEVNGLSTLRNAMGALFDKHAACAIAVKSQHAYNRTLLWQDRSDTDASAALSRILKAEGPVDEATRLCLGDWCWARGVELAIDHDLPFKLHTGYNAGNNGMVAGRIPSGNLSAILARYLGARFVLMHIAYPYQDEIVGMAKHYTNVWVDMCWAWAMDPFSSSDFLRRFIHAAPINKLFGFGGDTGWPTSAVAYAIQARDWLDRTLQAEVSEGLLTESQAIEVASMVMRENQYACFDIEGTRQAIRARMAEGTT